ncbi:hypothetical protein [Acetobacter fallax]|uniref:Uncharacterized protein n=1 Tax=Acetobacter fallax TaxID=1737473 RepID=A0ABX0KB01_9PROT|nr:hypothetical protein [Acetobacter fallax]NHO32609.1 hypothetical protein [Acetobacter fallax]NHO36193.1 hypothetical protein [Acetobacter fallax]
MSPVLPEWLPLWAQLLVLVAAAAFGMAFLLMPFAVFGLKGRLAEVELQLTDARAELRVIAMRLGSASQEPGRRPEQSAPVIQKEWVPPAKPASVATEPEFRPATAQKNDTPPVAQPDLDPSAPPPKNSNNGYFFPPSAGEASQSDRKVRDGSERISVADREATERRGSGEVTRPDADTASRVTYGFSPAPHVSDAYEPRQNVLPELRASRQDDAGRDRETHPTHDQIGEARRMPWHQPPARSRNDSPGPTETNDGRLPGERTEPMLRWPARRPE